MDRRLDLEKLSYKELQAEVRKHGLKPTHSREGCIDLLMGLFESSVQPHPQETFSSAKQQVTQHVASNLDNPDPQESSSSSSNQVISFPVANLNLMGQPTNQSEDSPCPPVSQAFFPSDNSSKSTLSDSISILCSLVSEQMKQHQQMMQLLSTLATTHFSQHERPHSSSPPFVSHRSNSDGTGGSYLPVPTKISVNTVNLLASQLPEFSGKEDDDVEIWIQKIERVGRIHGASQDMMLLAASGKLVKSARKWFELGTGTINDTWISFKNALLRQFKRKIPYQVIMKKVDARKWNLMQESFNDYALEKLSLMQSLKLSEDDSIHFLIDGINNPAIRSAAAVIRANSLDNFLEEMHKITLSFGNLFKKEFSHSRSEKVRNPSGDTSSKGDKSDKDQKDQKENYCVYSNSRSQSIKLF